MGAYCCSSCVTDNIKEHEVSSNRPQDRKIAQELGQIYEEVSIEQAETSELIRNLNVERDVIENMQRN